ncbi:MAG: glycosyltransferase [Deltaproteobacteria bacterium]|nr:glycosyltransferase [Deltaproteobacteria bacterium]
MTLRQYFQERDSPYEVQYFDVSSKQGNKNRGKLNPGNLEATLKLSLLFAKILAQKRPFVVTLPLAQNFLGFMKYSLLLWIASFFHCKIIASLGGAHFDLFFKRSSPLLKKWILKTLGQIDILVVQGESLRRQFEGLIDSSRIRSAHLGLDPNPFLCSGKKSSGEVNVLFVGCLSKAKGVFELLKAAPLVSQKVTQIHFHLVGEILERERNILHLQNPENNREAFLKLLEESRKKSRITLHGVLEGEKKNSIFKSADIFVLPSWSESFPFVLLEAAASGLALVTTDVGANREIYCEGENAFYVSPGDALVLAEKISRLALDPALRERMGDNNRKLIEQNHTHTHFGERMDKIFRELLEKEI